jgi:adenylylsulfate kinase
MVIWLIGLAGAGKTTLGRSLHARLKEIDRASVFLDGDHVREIMGQDLGHSLEDRRRNGWRMCRLCQYLDRQNINVVCAILSMFAEQQAWNREAYSDYFEVFLNVPMHELEARDQKGLYSGARAGTIANVAGIDLPFRPPAAPHMVVRNDRGIEQLSAAADDILARIKPRMTASHAL